MAEPVKLLSAGTVIQLMDGLDENIERYRSGSFTDLAKGNGWGIETTIARWDPSISSALDPGGTPEAEIRNSLLIYRGLEGMTPALAREERLWTRLCHVECLDFTRQRWIRDGTDIKPLVRSHFFATGLRGCRDRNAVGRLWWNGHVASIGSPGDIELGLRRLLGRANTRLQIVDRADSAFRAPLIAGIFRLLGADQWFNAYDAAVADFMYEVNKRSGGLMFEALTEAGVDSHLKTCLSFAKARRSPTTREAA